MAKQSVLQLGRGANGYSISDNCYRICAKSGVIGAAAAANSIFFSMRPGTPDSPEFPAVVTIQKIRLQYTTITAFTVPVTAGRSLAIGTSQSGATAAGGTLISSPFNKGGGFETSVLDSGLDGQIMMATTAPLSGVTLQAGQPRFAELSLAGYGAAGATVDKTWDLSCNDADPLIIATQATGRFANYEQLVLFNPAAMDAAGTFEIVLELDVCELPENFPFPS